MLSGIFFEDFQGFRGTQYARLAPITLIFGANASGKSSFARAIRYLQLLYSQPNSSNSNILMGSTSEAYLAYGWRRDVEEDKTYTVGLSLAAKHDLIAGHSLRNIENEATSVHFSVSLGTKNGDYQMKQVINFLPSESARIANDFRFLIPTKDLTVDHIKEAIRRLTEAQERGSKAVNLLEKPVIAKTSSEPLHITTDAIARERAYKESCEKIWKEIEEWFNSEGDVLKYEAAFLASHSFEFAARYASALLKFILESGDSLDDLSETHALIHSGEFPHPIARAWANLNDAESASGAADGGHPHPFLLEEHQLEPEIDSHLPALINTNGLLFRYADAIKNQNDPLNHPDPWSYQDWAEGFELTAHEFVHAFHSNSETLADELRSVRFIGGWRGIPSKTQGDDPLYKISSNTLAAMNQELGRITGGRYEYLIDKVAAIRPENRGNDPLVRDIFTGVEIPFSEVGIGLSQIQPILADLFSDERWGLTFIEEPELHLHPRLQSDLMDSILNRTVNKEEGANKRQFILETHSESMLLRLQKRIREGVISKEDVCVLYVESVAPDKTEDGKGYNSIMEFELDQLGDIIDPFPTSFAALRLEDLL